ncbi:hypothetical protein CBR_g11936 [Chara braunii]|uniref:Uncharacterized protein n=1 Tax=Chara braunii TaxID=69332 RepID=A0A388KQT3_CHABU|nr:hypothetical protein CBR_g11936 [Chara braunii]|eukprot:GBG72358.1 hypothetical protein CBR_g11936 [Chara braunii]
MEERRIMDEKIRLEIERNAEALEARVMSKIGRQYLVARDEARREEIKTPVTRTPMRVEREEDFGDYANKGLEEIDDEIAKLYELRERKRKGKEFADINRRPFKQPVFRQCGEEEMPAESSRMGEERTRTKITAGSGPEGVLAYVQAQRKILMTKNKDQLKVICRNEGVIYTSKAPTIEKIIEARAKMAYKGFVFTPVESPAGSPDLEQTPAK